MTSAFTSWPITSQPACHQPHSGKSQGPRCCPHPSPGVPLRPRGVDGAAGKGVLGGPGGGEGLPISLPLDDWGWETISAAGQPDPLARTGIHYPRLGPVQTQPARQAIHSLAGPSLLPSPLPLLQTESCPKSPLCSAYTTNQGREA